ncbi:polyprenol phosphomannose-dependent alpha 1,6 mannosyltransferase MptB [Galactobacter valiniphilus]|uniref:polyprenol phosphomannose-dependent alpha 1,6 mannosyltransferase MptB n=1 Tax=Galactobacter valiniphilus TaxID=2676122 RepID=UPI00373633A8
MNAAVAPASQRPAARGSFLLVLAEGLIGAVLVFIGALGVGWLAPGSALNRWPSLVFWRIEIPGVMTAVVALTAGVWVMFSAWLRLGRYLQPWGQSMRALWIALVVWSLPLMVSIPIFSRDVYAYIGQGRLMRGGFDPYVDSISVLPNWLQLGTDVMWADSQTAYGPLFYWMAAGTVALTGLNIEASILGFRLLSWVGIALVMFYLPRLAKLHGVNGVKANWITVANPLFLLSFLASAHNDALMIGLAVGATYYAAKRRGVLAIVFLVASVGIKPITLITLPFLALLWAGPNASWPKRIRYWAYAGVLTIALCWLMGLPGGLGFGWISATLSAGSGYYVIYAPLGFACYVLFTLCSAFGLGSEWVLSAVGLLGRVAGLAIAVYLVFKGSYSRLVQRLLLAFAAITVLAPVVHPWYLLWLLPFFAATGIRDDWQSLWVYATVGFFIALGCIDQMFVWDFNNGWKGTLQLISLAVTIISVALLLCSRATRRQLAPLMPRRVMKWLTKVSAKEGTTTRAGDPPPSGTTAPPEARS